MKHSKDQYATRQSRRRARVVMAALAVVALTLATFAAGALTPPRWWAGAGVLPPDTNARAAALERGATRALYEPRSPGDAWSVRMDAADLNAWLAHRLEPWAESRSIEARGLGCGATRVSAASGRARVAVRRGMFVLGVVASPRIEEGGVLLHDVRLTIGRWTFPRGMGLRLLRLLLPRQEIPAGETALRGGVESVLVGGMHPGLGPIRLDDGRTIRWESCQADDKGIVLTFRTFAASDASAGHALDGPSQSR